ncbi:MAG TPA: TylF/MycF/NovP-related O-methyltransferase [Solimonas sp.]
MINKLRRHLKRGTLFETLQYRMGKLPLSERTRWYGANSVDEAAEALARRAQRLLHDGPTPRSALVVGDGGALQQALVSRLQSRKVEHQAIGIDAVAAWSAPTGREPGMVLCALTDARRTTEVGRATARHAQLGEVPFEYVSGLDREAGVFAKLDEYATTFFSSPQLLEPFSVYGLYEESLQRFEQKCGLRDYLDFSQCIRHVVQENIPGDIAEFGSFRGHSGWLMSGLLKALGSDKTLHMFDMFEHFPSENLGVDYFWSKTHAVNFDEVRSKFHDRPNVKFVKGDFTKTLETSGVGQLSMAYVDCDSLRATRYLIDAILDRHLAPGGLIVVEDYGHPALLGSRIAVHDALDQRRDLFRFYSQFSGLYVAAKLR